MVCIMNAIRGPVKGAGGVIQYKVTLLAVFLNTPTDGLCHKSDLPQMLCENDSNNQVVHKLPSALKSAEGGLKNLNTALDAMTI